MPNYFPEGDAPSALDDQGDKSRSLQKINSLLYDASTKGGLGGVTSAAIYQLAVSGSGYTTLIAQPAKRVTLINTSGNMLSVQRGGAGAAWPLLPNASKVFAGITNSNQIGVKAEGLPVGSLTVTYEIEN